MTNKSEQPFLPASSIYRKQEQCRLKRLPAGITGKNHPNDKTPRELFEEQVTQTPGKTALVFEDSHFTYRKLNQLANKLARVFKNKGIKPGSIVGLMTDHPAESVIGWLGILKSGGACLSLDPGLPGDRLTSILEDCPPSLLLTHSSGFDQHFSQRRGETRLTPEKPYLTAQRPQIVDMDGLPIINRSLVSYEKYYQHISGTIAQYTISLSGTRGCPYHCVYCHKLWPKKHVRRSAENISREIRCCYDMGIRNFTFIDDIFNLDEKNSSRVFRMIIKNCPGTRLFFPNGVRGDILTHEYIDLMMEAGMVNLTLPLETASPRIQRLIRKNLRLEKFKENIEYIIKKYPQVILELEMMTIITLLLT